MSATDAATYPGTTLLETINNPSKGAKISPILKQQLPRAPVVTAVLNGDHC
jgi:hypothetical protein